MSKLPTGSAPKRSDSQQTGTHQSVLVSAPKGPIPPVPSGDAPPEATNGRDGNSAPSYSAAHVAPRTGANTSAANAARGASRGNLSANGLMGALRRSRVPATTRRLRRRGVNLFERARTASINAAANAAANAASATANRRSEAANTEQFMGDVSAPSGGFVIEQPSAQVYASPREMIDYRDRISVVTWLVVFGLGLSLLFSMPSLINFEWVIFTTPLAFELTDNVVASVFLAGLAALGTQSVIEVHPSFATGRFSRWRSAVFWALPAALTIIATYLLPFAPNRPLQILGLLLSGVFIALSLFCLYATVEIGQPGFRRSRLVLNSLAYGSALLLFVFVYQTRTRSLVSATVISITATLLAVEVLRSTTLQADLVFIYGAIVGFVLGQVTWALNYWPVPNLTGGLLLLLIFYLLVGVAQQGLQERLTRRILLEFGVFTLVSILLIAFVGPGFGG